MSDDNLDRFVSNVSAVKLSKSLGIDVDIERVQRWEIERANGERTEQFLDYYDRCPWLDDDDKFALMALIVASFDDWVLDHPGDHPLRHRIRARLEEEFETHAATIYYWCRWDVTDPDPEYVFKITSFMREIWCSRRPTPEIIPDPRAR
jgi:hypothetical protein